MLYRSYQISFGFDDKNAGDREETTGMISNFDYEWTLEEGLWLLFFIRLR
jgi:hypothetical protein